MQTTITSVKGHYPLYRKKQPAFRASNIMYRVDAYAERVELSLSDIANPDFALTIDMPRAFVDELILLMNQQKRIAEAQAQAKP